MVKIFLRSMFLSVGLPLSSWAIVVMTPHDIGEKPGMSGEVSGALTSTQGNSETTRMAISTVGYYDTGRDVTTLSAAYTYGESQGTADTDKTFLHARRFAALNDQGTLGHELFVQYGRDLFKALEEQEIIGGGIRQKFGVDPKNRLYIGLGAMGVREKEKSLGQDQFIAGNLYVNHVSTWDDGKKVLLTLYYQPRLDQWDDFRSLGSASLDVPVVGHLFFSGLFSFSYDATPASGVKTMDTTTMTMLKYLF